MIYFKLQQIEFRCALQHLAHTTQSLPRRLVVSSLELLAVGRVEPRPLRHSADDAETSSLAPPSCYVIDKPEVDRKVAPPGKVDKLFPLTIFFNDVD